MKKVVCICALALIVFTSCNRYITPFEAANGKAKCGRLIR
jgi:hypothetical protein